MRNVSVHGGVWDGVQYRIRVEEIIVNSDLLLHAPRSILQRVHFQLALLDSVKGMGGPFSLYRSSAMRVRISRESELRFPGSLIGVEKFSDALMASGSRRSTRKDNDCAILDVDLFAPAYLRLTDGRRLAQSPGHLCFVVLPPAICLGATVKSATRT